MSFVSLLLLLTPGWPLLLAAALACRPRSRLLAALAATGALPALLLAMLGAPAADSEFPWLLLDLRLGLDAVGQTFLRFSALLWLAAALYAPAYLGDDRRRARFQGALLAAMAGNLGLIVARDMVGFYCFFALMSFASFPLIVHTGDAAARHAGRVYIVLVVLGELALFAGLLLAAHARWSIEFDQAPLAQHPLSPLAIALLGGAFAIKAGLAPLHVWLPLAHPAAPAPASAVLSGAMIKAGLLGWMRLLPLGEAASPAWSDIFLLLGLATVALAVIVGIGQRNPKTVLAYSSIGQMGLLAVGIGAAWWSPAAWPALAAALSLYALQHGLAKGALFLSVGVAPTVGAARWRRALWTVGIAWPALSLAGAPLTIGAVAKERLKYALVELPPAWSPVLAWAFPLAALGTTLLMARFVYLAWPRGEAATAPKWGLWAPWLGLVGGVAAAAWLAPTSLVEQGIGAEALARSLAWSNAWPLLSGVALAVAAWIVARRCPWLDATPLPAGDILTPLSIAGRYLTQQGHQAGASAASWIAARRALAPPGVFLVAIAGRRLREIENQQGSWPWVAVAVVVVVGLLAWRLAP